MRKIFYCLKVIFLLFSTFSFAEQTKKSLYPLAPDIKKIIDRGELVVVITKDDQPPFYYLDKQGELTGLDIKLAKLIAQELGVKVVFNREAESFNDLVDLVARGKADIAISKLSRTLARAQSIRYTLPYITFRQGLLVNRLTLAKNTKSKSVYEYIKDFRGKVGVIKSSSYVSYARKNFPKAQIMEFENWDPDIIKAVIDGTIDIAYRDEMEIKKIIKGNPEATLKLKTIILKDKQDPIAMAVNRDNSNFVAWLNIYLDSLQLDLTAEKLLNEYADIFQGEQSHAER